MAATAMNTTLTTSHVHVSGWRCCSFELMNRSSLAQRSRNGRAGNAHPSAAQSGRTRALTPRAVPGSSFWRLLAGETRATRDEMATAGPFVHPLIRGDFGQLPGSIARSDLIAVTLLPQRRLKSQSRGFHFGSDR
jgi:hypothetical protein